jgi:hypothetical protein
VAPWFESLWSDLCWLDGTAGLGRLGTMALARKTSCGVSRAGLFRTGYSRPAIEMERAWIAASSGLGVLNLRAGGVVWSATAKVFRLVACFGTAIAGTHGQISPAFRAAAAPSSAFCRGKAHLVQCGTAGLGVGVNVAE